MISASGLRAHGNKSSLHLFLLIALLAGSLQASKAEANACVDNLAVRAKTGEIQLTWDHVADTVSYDILRSEGLAATFAKIADTQSTVSTYLDASGIPGTLYYYKIERFPAIGASCQSEIIAAFVPPSRVRMATVPLVVGQVQADAEAAIVAANLAVGTITPVNSAVVPAGQIIAQDPPQNSTVPQDFSIDLNLSLGPANQPPAITSVPPTTATEGDLYTYDVEAVDPNAGDTLTFSLDVAPAGMSIDPVSGLIQWTPNNAQLGANGVGVRVVDGNGGFATQAYTIQVDASNQAPAITSVPLTTATEGQLYTYDVEAVDPNAGDTLTFSLDLAPAGMSIDSLSGLIQWTPDNSQIGANGTAVRVEDGNGGFATQAYTIQVDASNQAPAITSVPLTTATEGQLYTYDVEAVDPNAGDTLTFSLDLAPAGMSIDPSSGLIQWTPNNTQLGANGVGVRVVDGNGGIATQGYTILVESGNQAPSITSVPLTTATENQLYTYDVEAVDPNAGDTLTFSLDAAPAGMSIDPSSGLIQWTPNNSQLGANGTAVRVVDGNGGFATQAYTIQVDASNQAPAITSVPLTTATEGQLYTYDVEAVDPNAGDTLTFSLDVAPAGMSIDPVSGLIQWTPDNSQLGANGTAVRVVDGNGGFATQAYTILVDPSNQAPSITSVPLTTATEGQLYTYDVEAVDPNAGDTLTFSLDAAPAGMSIDPSSGLIQWTPNNTQLGANGVGVRVVDGNGGIATQSYTINVDADTILVPDLIGRTQPAAEALIVSAGLSVGNISTAPDDNIPAGLVIDQDPPANANVPPGTPVDLVISSGSADDVERPAVTLNATPETTDVGQTIALTVIATDDTGVVSRTLLVDGVPLALDPAGQANFSSANAGIFTAVATAEDAAGNEGTASVELRFLTPGDVTPPTVAIDAPAELAELILPTDIVGTATDDTELIRSMLEYSSAGRNDFISFASNDTDIVNDVLGQLDPTMLRNGLYDIRLTAEDASGNVASVTETVQLSGEAKVGNFSLNFTDLTIPVSGIPILIDRTYSSMDKSSGDFGVGWRIGLRSMDVEENRNPADGWEFFCIRQIFGTCLEWSIRPSVEHRVVVTRANGDEDEFLIGANTTFANPSGLVNGTLTFTPLPGTTSTLEALDNTVIDLLLGGVLTDLSFVDVDPDRYRLTDADGTAYDLNQATGVERIVEPNGNTVTFGPGGIIHSAGKSVLFARDPQGRITTITDPLGNTIEYAYDFYGDLVSVTDQEGDTTRFTYNSNHGLLDVIDPRGVRGVRNEYDDDGRLVATVDGAGNRIEFTHDLGSQLEIVRDRRGNATVFGYDGSGNVTSETDALGNVMNFTYDADGNQLTETDPLGNTTSRTFDARGDDLTKTNPLGFTESYTYNSRGELLTTTDPLGNVSSNTRDASGNLLTITDPLGNTVTNTYDGNGNILTTTDPLGNVRSFVYDAFGNRISETDPLGVVTTYTFDDNGNELTQTTPRTDSTGATVMDTITRVYDGRGRIVTEINPLGAAKFMEYDGIGNVTAETDENGNRTEHFYDARGELVRSVFADGTEENVEYDAEGNETARIDRDGRRTELTYDALNRLVQTDHPDGAVETRQYDAADRLIGETDGNGNQVQFEYDAAGNNTRVTDPLGQSTLFTYDGNGNQLSMTDANGNTTTFDYDPLDRRVRTNFPVGSFALTGYDALGRTTSETDQAGNVTQFEYDPLGRLTRVIDALGGNTGFAYDEVGNRTSQTDANGNTTQWAYDGAGRVTSRTLPLGMVETFTYDPKGNRLSHTDFNGDTTLFAYDVYDRLAQKNFADGSTVDFTYTPNGALATATDSRGITSHTYDALDRLTRVDHPDGSAIQYTYDAAGNRTTTTVPTGMTTFTYDAANRLASVLDPNANLTTYSYDPVGNLAGIDYANGATTTYTYDTLNRLTGLATSDSVGGTIVSYNYTLGAAGNRTRVVESSGRQVDYTYDALYRLTGEQVTDLVAGAASFLYTYDAVGNRLSKTANGLTVNNVFDANDRLLAEGPVSYSYDDNGNQISRTSGVDVTTYAYDPENRLVAAIDASSTTTYAYDHDGIRVSSANNGTATNFLVDKNRDFAQVLEERNGVGGLVVAYVHGDDLISQSRPVDGDHFYHADGLGSTRALSDAAGSQSDSYTYDAFGNLLGASGVTDNNYLFAGEQLDPNVGFYYLRARYYAPKTGRFLSMDPWRGNIFDPLSLHKYLYAHADPVNNVDPSGKFVSLGSISIGLRLYAINFLRVASPALYLMNHIVQRLGSSSVAMSVRLYVSTFTSGAYRLAGLSPRLLRLDAGRMFEQILRPGMRLLTNQYQTTIRTVLSNARPDWIVGGRNIVDAKLGQAISSGQFAKFVAWAGQRGGNIVYITLTKPPAGLRQALISQGAQSNVSVSFLYLLPF